ncbi:hypothetical protein SRHO_G00077250 [Serrasalmus rhombeus]
MMDARLAGNGLPAVQKQPRPLSGCPALGKNRVENSGKAFGSSAPECSLKQEQVGRGYDGEAAFNSRGSPFLETC